MGESISDEVKGIYIKKRQDIKDKAESLRKELDVAIDRNRNESLKEV